MLIGSEMEKAKHFDPTPHQRCLFFSQQIADQTADIAPCIESDLGFSFFRLSNAFCV
jgi:hypothetical protein